MRTVNKTGAALLPRMEKYRRYSWTGQDRWAGACWGGGGGGGGGSGVGVLGAGLLGGGDTGGGLPGLLMTQIAWTSHTLHHRTPYSLPAHLPH